MEKKINNKSIGNSYHLSQIIIHWVIAFLVIYQFTSGEGIEFLVLESCIKSETNDLKSCQYLNNHYVVGVIIFLLMIIRLFLRFLLGSPQLHKSVPLIIKILAKLSHGIIYSTLLLMPISGLFMYYFNSGISQFLHIVFSKILLFLILLHICAVAFHEGVLGSKLFYRMASISKEGDK